MHACVHMHVPADAPQRCRSGSGSSGRRRPERQRDEPVIPCGSRSELDDELCVCLWAWVCVSGAERRGADACVTREGRLAGPPRHARVRSATRFRVKGVGIGVSTLSLQSGPTGLVPRHRTAITPRKFCKTGACACVCDTCVCVCVCVWWWWWRGPLQLWSRGVHVRRLLRLMSCTRGATPSHPPTSVSVS
jgi:hypothetical protein